KDISKKEILLEGAENSNRKVRLLKVAEAYRIFKELIIYHGTEQLLHLAAGKDITSVKQLIKEAGPFKRHSWINAGGQLIPAPAVDTWRQQVRSGKSAGWGSAHAFYHQCSSEYPVRKARHAIAVMLELTGIRPASFTFDK